MGGWRVPLHVYALQLDSPDQRSSPLSCFSEPRKAYKSSRWPEQMVPVLGPVAQPENRLHLLGQHEGWRNWFTSLIISAGGSAYLGLNAHSTRAGTTAPCSVITNMVAALRHEKRYLNFIKKDG